MRSPFKNIGIIGAVFLLLGVAVNAPGEDVLHLKDGQTIRCTIEAITDNILTYQTAIDLGGGQSASARRTVSPALVDYIEFTPLPGEQNILEKPESADPEAVKKLWIEASRNLHRPRSNGGKIGLLHAETLLRSEKKFEWNSALAIFDRIREKDWNPENRNAAFQGRLKTLIRMGDLETALYEAQQLAGESENPAMLIEAKYALARVDFEKLKQIESENPKWEEDDTVRPERNRLYHRTVDQFLWPYLFHGTREEVAARGLVAAGEVYRFAGREEDAQACFGDAIRLYPETEHSRTAREHTLSETQSQDEKDETQPQE